MVGGVFGVLVLLCFAPPLARFAMRFGPSELFWTAIFGITVITGLSSGGMLKGLFGGALGMLISTIGYSQISGEPRFIFHEDLSSGIALVPALIGFFAVPQVIDLMRDAHVKLAKLDVKAKKGMLRRVIKSLATYARTLTIGSTLGTVIGIIPGAGGQIAGLMAYDQVKKLSKHPERFGQGNPEGLCASESANNATVGPALIPMLTLGIPGSPTAAVLLGGLLIHGLFPGPDLFTKHAGVTYTFLGGLLLAQFAMFALGILASRYSQYVANVPNHIMFGAVVILCVFGSYCVSNNFTDVLIMFVLGMAMFVLDKLASPAPLVLGIILGPIAEENFLRGKMIAENGCGPVLLLLHWRTQPDSHCLERVQLCLGHRRRNKVRPQACGRGIGGFHDFLTTKFMAAVCMKPPDGPVRGQCAGLVRRGRPPSSVVDLLYGRGQRSAIRPLPCTGGRRQPAGSPEGLPPPWCSNCPRLRWPILPHCWPWAFMRPPSSTFWRVRFWPTRRL